MRFFIFCKIILFISFNSSITSLLRHYSKKKYFLLNSSKNENQCIISAKNNTIFCNSSAKLYISENSFLNNKKLITISPGGFKGFYLLGILTYLKENYDFTNFIFSGASAGSWNCLFMCYKGDPLEFALKLFESNIKKAKTIIEFEICLKYNLLSNYKESDFDLRRLFIGVSTLKNFVLRKNIFSDFNSLEDAINCCMASSHIPLITGGITNRYKNMFSFDGGFSNYPYLDKEKSILMKNHVTFVALKNGMHSGEGYIFSSWKNNVNHIKDIFNEIDKFFETNIKIN